jgi:hypothetical protein
VKIGRSKIGNIEVKVREIEIELCTVREQAVGYLREIKNVRES